VRVYFSYDVVGFAAFTGLYWLYFASSQHRPEPVLPEHPSPAISHGVMGEVYTPAFDADEHG